MEAHAQEIARLLGSVDRETREELRDYVAHLLREEAEPQAAPEDEPETPKTAAFNALGIGIPVLMMGAVLLVVFPPVGLLLLGVAGLLLVWGVLAALFTRRPAPP